MRPRSAKARVCELIVLAFSLAAVSLVAIASRERLVLACTLTWPSGSDIARDQCDIISYWIHPIEWDEHECFIYLRYCRQSVGWPFGVVGSDQWVVFYNAGPIANSPVVTSLETRLNIERIICTKVQWDQDVINGLLVAMQQPSGELRRTDIRWLNSAVALLWWIALLRCILVAIALVARSVQEDRSNRQLGVCAICGYECGSLERCPECGALSKAVCDADPPQ